MAHFAKLDENNIVLEVLVVNNEDIVDDQGEESEQKGVDFLSSLTGHGSWKQTSIHHNFRKAHAGIGDVYDEELDAFYSPNRPYKSWSFNKEKCFWEAPVPHPDMEGTNVYLWSELTSEWVLIHQPYGETNEI